MPKEKKKKEIFVRSFYLNRIKKPLFKDTTGAESFDLFKFSEIAGRFLSGVLIISSLFLFIAAYLIFSNAAFSLSAEMRPPLLSGLIFLGAINTICGLILMAKE
jgi:hypothetical protein